MPKKNPGTAAPLIDKTINRRSRSELARTAAITPAGIAITRARIIE
jgi:hypothetical protein